MTANNAKTKIFTSKAIHVRNNHASPSLSHYFSWHESVRVMLSYVLFAFAKSLRPHSVRSRRTIPYVKRTKDIALLFKDMASFFLDCILSDK